MGEDIRDRRDLLTSVILNYDVGNDEINGGVS